MAPTKILLEVPIFSQTSADSIANACAELDGTTSIRLELNAHGSYPQGGTTPAQATYHNALHASSTGNTSTPALRIMIRPRGPPPPADAGSSPDFVYTAHEVDVLMKQAMLEWKESGAMSLERGDGFVFGVLKEKTKKMQQQEENGTTTTTTTTPGSGVVVDVARCSHLVKLAAPFPCVFHRAFDDILGSAGSTVEEALADVALCGFTGILTSGGPGRAIDNVDTVSRIVETAPASLREIIVGGGVRSSNVRELAKALPRGLRASSRPEVVFHSSCLTDPSVSDVLDGEELRSITEGVKMVSLNDESLELS